MRDFKRMQEDPPVGISGAPVENDIMKWNAVIFGPSETPFEEGTFKLMLEFSEDYPNKSPVVKFQSRMFHPNIYSDGSICLDILQSRWSPTYDVSAILTSIQSLLSDFQIRVDIKVLSDATAAIGMARRLGLGRVRHLAISDLWVQQRVRSGDVSLAKYPGTENGADLTTKYQS